MLTIDASGPTTVHPVMPVEPLRKFVKPPTGTKGVSKLPLTMSFARAADAAKTRIKSLWNASAQKGTGIINVGGGGSNGLLMVSNGGQVIANQVNVNSGGTLSGQGVTGNVTNNGGTVTPTDGPGLMTITGNYTQNSGALVFDIDGDQPGQFDQLSVHGLANFTGGTIDVNFENGFEPLAGDTFDLILRF